MKTSNVQSLHPTPDNQMQLFARPMEEEAGLKTQPGRVMAGLVQYHPRRHTKAILAMPPNPTSTHFPVMSICSAASYAQERTNALVELLSRTWRVEDLLVLNANGGDWTEVLRTTIFQAVIDGYGALKSGVPVAIPEDAGAVPESTLEGKTTAERTRKAA